MQKKLSYIILFCSKVLSLQFHRQTYAVSVHIHIQDLDMDLLIKVYHLIRVFDVVVGHLADVDEAVLMHADVDESAEGGDIGDDAVEGHPDAQVVDGADVLVELESFKRFSWVAARLVQFGEDVVDGLGAELLFYKLSRIDFGDEFLVADEVFHFHAQFLGHFFHDVVALGVDGALVQRIVAIVDTQEASALLEGLVAEARHLFELFAALESAVFLTICDDVGSQGRADATHIR